MPRTEVRADAPTRLDDLAALSKKLNEESNQINTILANFEKRLGEMNLGIEAWVRPWGFLGVHSPGLGQGHWTALTIDFSTQDDGEELMNCEVLGYGVPLEMHASNPKGKESRYSLLVRKELYYKELSEDDSEPSWVFQGTDSTIPLLQASRELRLAALERLEYLVEALEIESQRLLSTIEKGRKIVEQL